MAVRVRVIVSVDREVEVSHGDAVGIGAATRRTHDQRTSTDMIFN